MIFNRPKRQEKKRLTWYFNDAIDLFGLPSIGSGVGGAFNVAFTSGGNSFSLIQRGSSGSGSRLTYRLYYNNNYDTTRTDTRYSQFRTNPGSWSSETYRTIAFDEEPTGDLLTWLEANATPQ